jgi:hypothetical protein
VLDTTIGGRRFDRRGDRTKLPEFYTNRGRLPESTSQEREPMPVTNCSGRLRELAERCRRAARKSFEVEAKGTLRTTADDLSSIADELERSAISGGRPRSS